MEGLLTLIFMVNVSLILIHEMDAIRNKEWKMFVFLKNIEQNKASKIFILLHLPIYIGLLYFMHGDYYGFKPRVYLALDIFLIFHSIIHFLFRRHKENGFESVFSNFIIYSMGLLSIFHILGMLYHRWI